METKQTHIPYGLVTGIVMVVVGMGMYFAGLAFIKGMSYVSYIPLLAGIIMNALAYSKANEGYVTFGNVFGSCFKMSMIVTIVMVIWGVLSLYLLPEMKEQAIEMVRKQSAENPAMTDDILETTLNITRKYYNVMVIAGAIFGGLFTGAILSLIAAAIAPKKGERPMVTGDNF